MEFGKLQRFLKARHKFDKRKKAYEIIEDVTNLTNKMNSSIEKGNSDAISEDIGNYIVELIKVCNDFGIDLEETFKDKLKFGF